MNMEDTCVCIKTIIAAALLVCGASALLAYPSSLNYIPTAETLGANTLLLEASNYGYSTMMTTESTSGIMTQLGIGNRLEFGVDKYETEDSSENYWNGKLKLFDEGKRTPAFAVGFMDIARASKPTSYFVMSKAIGTVRTHFGVINSSYSHGLMVGADIDIGESLWLGVDYLPGDANHLRVGVSHKLGSDSWLTLAAGKPNSRSETSSELGLTFSSYIDLSRE